MSENLRQYRDHLEYPGSESSLSLDIDMMEDLLKEGYPVWEKIRAWGRWAKHEDINHPGNQYWSGLLYISFRERLPLYELGWPSWLAEEFTVVKCVRICRAVMQQLPDWIGRLPQLTTLSIGQTEGTPFNFDFNHYPILKTLPPLKIPNWLADLPNLNRLELNKMDSKFIFDPTFCHKNHIQELWIQDIRDMASPISDLLVFPALTHLRIANLESREHEFLSLLPSLSQLTSLLIGSPQFTEIPPEIRYLTSLKSLVIKCSTLSSLPSWLSDLHTLQKIVVDERYLDSYKSPNKDTITEFPAFLHNCSKLLWIQIPTSSDNPIRSLYGLPPFGRYFIAIFAAYPIRNMKYYFNLPSSVYRAIHAEFVQHHFTHLTEESHNGPIDSGIDDIYPPLSIIKLDYLTKYNNETTCLRCGNQLQTRNCNRCHFDYKYAPSLHPALLAFLASYYKNSFDSLIQQVKDGKVLSDAERERFVHECDYHYWQILLNNRLPTHDPPLLEALTTKFSLQLPNKHQIML